MGSFVHITDATFAAEVLRAPGLVITDFWAEWCIPCKRIAPILEELATEYAGRLKVTKLDVDSNPATPDRYNISGLPTLLVFRDGQLADTIVGFLPKDRLRGRIKQHLVKG
jgi:thioredoxin 1